MAGDSPANLAHWLWDFDARPLPEAERGPDSAYARTSRRGFVGTLYKTDKFLKTQPFGTVPCALDPTGEMGIFESNSWLRAVARAGQHNHTLYGGDISDYEKFFSEWTIHLFNKYNFDPDIAVPNMPYMAFSIASGLN